MNQLRPSSDSDCTQHLSAPQIAADLGVLIALGSRLDHRPRALRGHSIREFMIAALLKIRDRRGRMVRLCPNAAQAQYERTCARRNIVLKARQLGITTWIAARFFIQTITQPGVLSVQVAHDQRSAEQIFRIVHRFLANLPARLRTGALRTSRSNVRELTFPLLDSGYRVETAADPQAGRGLTIRHLHCSEVAGWPRDAAATLASLRAAVPPDGEITLESTANGASGCFYEEWQRAAEMGYVPHFFAWWWEPTYVKCLEEPGSERSAVADGRRSTADGRFTDEERALMANQGLTPEQIAFRREVRASFRGLARQEFAEEPQCCFIASGECVFDVETIERRLPHCPLPIESRDNARLLVWLPPRPGTEYVIGVDPAGGGTDGDYACAQVIDTRTGSQCAELCGHLTPQELATRVAALGREYNQALMAIERNNHGHSVLAYLAAAEKYDRVFVQNGQPGWLTSAATRPRIIAELDALLATAPELFSSTRLLEECRTFARRADGTTAALAGAHDDRVMAMAIAQAVRAETSSPRSSSVAFGSLDRTGMAGSN